MINPNTAPIPQPSSLDFATPYDDTYTEPSPDEKLTTFATFMDGLDRTLLDQQEAVRMDEAGTSRLDLELEQKPNPTLKFSLEFLAAKALFGLAVTEKQPSNDYRQLHYYAGSSHDTVVREDILVDAKDIKSGENNPNNAALPRTKGFHPSIGLDEMNTLLRLVAQARPVIDTAA